MIEEVLSHFECWDCKIQVLRTYYAYAEIPVEAKQSTQFAFNRKGKRGFTSPKKRAYVEKLAELLKESYKGPVIHGSIRLSVLYCFPWRKDDKFMKSLGWILKPTRGDLDNFFKPLADAMSGNFFLDDSQIVESRARKVHTGWQGIAVQVDEIKPNRS